ncbi:hypothetical protein F0562_025823 [Nyssa sinensis]|uniref:Uncharacterized protein n=1 Tax=Nyssa sinensis TaxID=561372 RepID=A0A5J5BD46_9ASTE|nr:hypothetical protein F0562_025823 [Nyssa sinensis]
MFSNHSQRDRQEVAIKVLEPKWISEDMMREFFPGSLYYECYYGKYCFKQMDDCTRPCLILASCDLFLCCKLEHQGKWFEQRVSAFERTQSSYIWHQLQSLCGISEVNPRLFHHKDETRLVFFYGKGAAVVLPCWMRFIISFVLKLQRSIVWCFVQKLLVAGCTVHEIFCPECFWGRRS